MKKKHSDFIISQCFWKIQFYNCDENVLKRNFKDRKFAL
jgi:hypothetical protein